LTERIYLWELVMVIGGKAPQGVEIGPPFRGRRGGGHGEGELADHADDLVGLIDAGVRLFQFVLAGINQPACDGK